MREITPEHIVIQPRETVVISTELDAVLKQSEISPDGLALNMDVVREAEGSEDPGTVLSRLIAQEQISAPEFQALSDALPVIHEAGSSAFEELESLLERIDVSPKVAAMLGIVALETAQKERETADALLERILAEEAEEREHAKEAEETAAPERQREERPKTIEGIKQWLYRQIIDARKSFPEGIPDEEREYLREQIADWTPDMVESWKREIGRHLFAQAELPAEERKGISTSFATLELLMDHPKKLIQDSRTLECAYLGYGFLFSTGTYFQFSRDRDTKTPLYTITNLVNIERALYGMIESGDIERYFTDPATRDTQLKIIKSAHRGLRAYLSSRKGWDWLKRDYAFEDGLKQLSRPSIQDKDTRDKDESPPKQERDFVALTQEDKIQRLETFIDEKGAEGFVLLQEAIHFNSPAVARPLLEKVALACTLVEKERKRLSDLTQGKDDDDRAPEFDESYMKGLFLLEKAHELYARAERLQELMAHVPEHTRHEGKFRRKLERAERSLAMIREKQMQGAALEKNELKSAEERYDKALKAYRSNQRRGSIPRQQREFMEQETDQLLQEARALQVEGRPRRTENEDVETDTLPVTMNEQIQALITEAVKLEATAERYFQLSSTPEDTAMIQSLLASLPRQTAEAPESREDSDDAILALLQETAKRAQDRTQEEAEEGLMTPEYAEKLVLNAPSSAALEMFYATLVEKQNLLSPEAFKELSRRRIARIKETSSQTTQEEETV